MYLVPKCYTATQSTTSKTTYPNTFSEILVMPVTKWSEYCGGGRGGRRGRVGIWSSWSRVKVVSLQMWK